jgi:hypothetical protein
MGNSRAYPVLRTGDLRAAFGAARRLLALASLAHGQVDVQAYTRTTADLSRYLPVLPAGMFGLDVPAASVATVRDLLGPYADEVLNSYPDFTPAAVAEIGRLPDLPIMLASEDQPIGSTEERFVRVVGADRARVVWRLGGWPPVPELDLGWQGEHAYLQLTINCSGIDCEERAAGHMLYVHVGPGEEARARWLAGRIGSSVVGPMEWGY